MKIGTITFHHAPSYGAFFQAYALRSYLESLGHEVTVIDYMPLHRQASIQKRWQHPWSWYRLGLNRSNLKCLDLVNIRTERVFSRTVCEHLNLTRRYESLKDLRSDPPRIDACFCGSDQVWNPEATGGSFDKAYFANFGPPDMLRVAYAGSFGKEELPERNGELARCLDLLDHVSVREITSVELLRECLQKEVTHVLDPTFLVDPSLFPEQPIVTPAGGYILSYFLTGSPFTDKVLKTVQKRLGLPIVDVRSAARFMGRSCQPSPLQLLYLLRNANFVVTDSFHGASLSIIFGVDFATIALSGKRADRIVRQRDLLKMLALSDRFITPDQKTPEDIEVSPISWDRPRKALDELRTVSQGFINTALREKELSLGSL